MSRLFSYKLGEHPLLLGQDLLVAIADRVARTAERAVRLNIDAAAVAQLPPPEKGPPSFKPRRGGRLSKMLGGNWRRH